MDEKLKAALSAYDRIMETQHTEDEMWDNGIRAGATLIVAALVGWDELRERDDRRAMVAQLKWLDGR